MDASQTPSGRGRHRVSWPLVLVAFALVAAGGMLLALRPTTGGNAPEGCAAENIDYYYDADTGLIDGEKMAELTWLPVSARDSATIIGCVPNSLADPTLDHGLALQAYGRGDPNVPLPIFDFDGELIAYFVVNKGRWP